MFSLATLTLQLMASRFPQSSAVIIDVQFDSFWYTEIFAVNNKICSLFCFGAIGISIVYKYQYRVFAYHLYIFLTMFVGTYFFDVLSHLLVYKYSPGWIIVIVLFHYIVRPLPLLLLISAGMWRNFLNIRQLTHQCILILCQIPHNLFLGA